MRLTINLQESLLCDFPAILLPCRLLLSPVSLQDAEYHHIETLVYVRGMRWVAEDMDPSCAGVVEELERVVGIMTINNQQAGVSVRLSLGILVKVF